MCDLSPFSSVVAELTPDEIRSVLSLYYECVVPIVREHGGVVEKFIGDAVVAVFGAPFTEEFVSSPDDLDAAVKAAQRCVEAVERLYGGEMSAKAAISFGDCFVGYLGVAPHVELTLVGNPLTELFRIEDTCKPREVALRSSLFSEVEDRFNWVPIWVPTPWRRFEERTVSLRGVGDVTLTGLSYQPGNDA